MQSTEATLEPCHSKRHTPHVSATPQDAGAQMPRSARWRRGVPTRPPVKHDLHSRQGGARRRTPHAENDSSNTKPNARIKRLLQHKTKPTLRSLEEEEAAAAAVVARALAARFPAARFAAARPSRGGNGGRRAGSLAAPRSSHPPITLRVDLAARQHARQRERERRVGVEHSAVARAALAASAHREVDAAVGADERVALALRQTTHTFFYAARPKRERGAKH